MEDTLRESVVHRKHSKKLCLNPCFNGRYSQRDCRLKNTGRVSLNPCFNGRYSQSIILLRTLKKTLVLILVLMEDTLRDLKITIKK